MNKDIIDDAVMSRNINTRYHPPINGSTSRRKEINVDKKVSKLDYDMMSGDGLPETIPGSLTVPLSARDSYYSIDPDIFDGYNKIGNNNGEKHMGHDHKDAKFFRPVVESRLKNYTHRRGKVINSQLNREILEETQELNPSGMNNISTNVHNKSDDFRDTASKSAMYNNTNHIDGDVSVSIPVTITKRRNYETETATQIIKNDNHLPSVNVRGESGHLRNMQKVDDRRHNPINKHMEDNIQSMDIKDVSRSGRKINNSDTNRSIKQTTTPINKESIEVEYKQFSNTSTTKQKQIHINPEDEKDTVSVNRTQRSHFVTNNKSDNRRKIGNNKVNSNFIKDERLEEFSKDIHPRDIRNKSDNSRKIGTDKVNKVNSNFIKDEYHEEFSKDIHPRDIRNTSQQHRVIDKSIKNIKQLHQQSGEKSSIPLLTTLADTTLGQSNKSDDKHHSTKLQSSSLVTTEIEDMTNINKTSVRGRRDRLNDDTTQKKMQYLRVIDEMDIGTQDSAILKKVKSRGNVMNVNVTSNYSELDEPNRFKDDEHMILSSVHKQERRNADDITNNEIDNLTSPYIGFQRLELIRNR